MSLDMLWDMQPCQVMFQGLLGTPHTRKGLLKYYMSTRITQNIKVRIVGHQKGGGLSQPSSMRAFP